ncbi:hypothetical protein [Vibrio phage vB_VpaS_SD15]|uniref:Uncharacterized protein n=1 Tax=Vibrio phage vB_VpaS_HCMJ TaxID=2601627 RepID=A0A5C2ICV3_9CAUD|nr:hypothetical protein HCMJ_104 [Vibrio phage vB_VpaS_HCMJ]UCW44098.1 hypothetical protein [Vibrio phage F23s1]UZM04652.1 hypothetical protein [Vibrio phage 31Fb.4]WAG58458.1 hypothetical protein [Vibrio phage 33Fb.4]WPH60381.1 hypothetical protein [Vibrio phage vB_VpaS_SD15]
MSIMIEIHKAENLDPESFPLCPYCDQPIQNVHDATIIYNGPFSVLALAHKTCQQENESQ